MSTFKFPALGATGGPDAGPVTNKGMQGVKVWSGPPGYFVTRQQDVAAVAFRCHYPGGSSPCSANTKSAFIQWVQSQFSPYAPYALADFDDRPINVGTRVRVWVPDEAERGEAEKVIGTVVDLGEWDGDVDSEGRSIGIPPRVTIDWDDGTRDSFVTSEWEFEGGYMEREPVAGRVEELVAFSIDRLDLPVEQLPVTHCVTGWPRSAVCRKDGGELKHLFSTWERAEYECPTCNRHVSVMAPVESGQRDLLAEGA